MTKVGVVGVAVISGSMLLCFGISAFGQVPTSGHAGIATRRAESFDAGLLTATLSRIPGKISVANGYVGAQCIGTLSCSSIYSKFEGSGTDLLSVMSAPVKYGILPSVVAAVEIELTDPSLRVETLYGHGEMREFHQSQKDRRKHRWDRDPVSVPEGGAPWIYLILAATPCFGAIFLAERKRRERRQIL